MLTMFAAPGRYVQGRDATRELGTVMAQVGLRGPALILASARISCEMADRWQQSLGAVGIDFTVHRFAGECSQKEIDAGAAAATAVRANTLIAVGGGKALDTGRAVGAAAGLKMVMCPTLASNDAPCSAVSVVYTESGEVQRIMHHPRNPELVLVDTTIIANSPARFLVAGMGDALATWFEARTVVEACKPNELGAAASMSAMALSRLCYDTLLADGPPALAAVEAGVVTPAVERLIEANTLLSGLGFESAGLAVAHSVHNGLTMLGPTHDFLHGEKVAFGLLVQLAVEGRPSAEFREVVGFCREVGLPTRLADIGLSDVSDDDLQVVAERTVAPGETAHKEPFEVTPELILDGIRAADSWAAAI
ncbi:MAG: glycerol dehydrogenase [Mycolicibacterium sp.]|uniref:glycerol dehydrogenase n=1 Tax=Mycolicibacterium sp. TaxID=2320850 RepID=UPI003D0AF949